MAVASCGRCNQMICKQVAHYLGTFTQITDRVGTHIYGSRIPKGKSPQFALKLRRIATIRHYNLDDEWHVCQSTIQIEGWSRHPGSEWTTLKLVNDCRLALNALIDGIYTIGPVGDQVDTHGFSVERDATHLPIDRSDASQGWVYRASMDVLLTHTQQTQLA